MSFFRYASHPFRWMKHRYIGHPWRVFSVAVKTYFIAHLLLEYGPVPVPTWGASMLPTLEVVGDSVMLSKQFRRGRGIVVGDIISFDSVAEPGERVIKRVLGLQGDYVLRNTPGTKHDDMIQVPEGHCWVVGDNLPYSRDSRHFGPVPMGLIRGKVIAKVSPWSERRWIVNDLQPVRS